VPLPMRLFAFAAAYMGYPPDPIGMIFCP
jgi:hypothetical protein